jgi:5-methylcytosine-specific restriction endonuclease McrA
MPYKDPIKNRENARKWNEKNKEKKQERDQERYAKNRKKCNQYAYDSIASGSIIDQNMWDVWCKEIKSSAKNHPYSADFTNGIMFDMMIQGCFYCGDIATTIDRIDSKLEHTRENCVGSCNGCNKSKGAADSDTFARKAYYRARGEYYDDDANVWFVHKNKPGMDNYKRKGVPFELTRDEWDTLVIGECTYCHRSPTTWFGIDRIVPSLGYVDGNVASCCWDCNNDKAKDDVKTMNKRNERIAQRMDDGELVIGGHEKVILHQGKKPFSMTVYARGKMYESISSAAKATKTSQRTFGRRISDGKDLEIFAVTKEFYEEYKDSENITKDMFIAFEHFYTNM